MFTNPEDYIKYYVDILKKEYDFNDLKIDYHGFVGFLMNLFGWTNFDIKQYYDYLYKEGFLATSEETKNLYLHASKHNYPIDFATPSHAQGNIIFDFSKLPIRSTNIKKREITFPSNCDFQINNFKFTSKTKYRFIEETKDNKTFYYCIIDPVNSRQRIISSSNSIINVPLIDFYQKQVNIFNYVVPNYSYGTYNQYSLNISETEQISNIEVLIKKSGSITYEPYDIKYVKAFETPLSKAIFLNRVSDKMCVIELGNGYHGEWIPNSVAQINLWSTYGSTGNSLKKQDANTSGSLNLIHFDVNNNIVNSGLITINDILMRIVLTSSVEGKDVLIASDLKKDIVNWIETRNNLINKNDFFNLFSRYHKDFNIVFKKHQLMDNNFYLLKVMRDQYQNILKTTNHTYSCIEYDNDTLIQNKSIDIQYYLTSKLVVGRYYYKIVAVDKFYESIPSENIIQNITTSERGIVLKWSPVENAEYYKVYGRNILYNQYWKVETTNLTNDGLIYFLDIGQTGTVETCNNTFKVNKQINFPDFNINLKETIDLTDDFYIWKTHTLENSYIIENKVIWLNSISSLTYNNVPMNYVDNISELISGTWTIDNKKLYVRFDDFFNSATSHVILEYNKTQSFFSPFIYKYNNFFNWFEGYFLFNNIIQYPINTIIDVSFTPPIFYFNLIFKYETNQTEINIMSYQDLSRLTFKMKVLNFDNDFVNVSGFKHIVDGFISDITYISTQCYLGGVLKFSSITPSFQQVYFIRDQLVLLNYYDEDNKKYICNVPVIDYNLSDRDYVYSQLYDYIIASNLSQNRMQSDSIQTRFMNTIFCEKNIGQKLLVQNYDHNLILPLNINIKIRYNTSSVDFTSQQSEIELLVAKYLQDNATGINIKYYNSQIIELIHNYEPKIISVIVDVFDSYGTVVNEGIETLQENDFMFKIQDKLDIVKYNSIYWYWNLDNINIELSL